MIRPHKSTLSRWISWMPKLSMMHSESVGHRPRLLEIQFLLLEPVFHIALVVRWWERSRSLLPLSERANLEGTRNVLKASRRAGVSTLVYTSSASVGISLASRWFLWPWEKRFIQVVNENDRRLPTGEHQFSNYSLSKIKAERLVRSSDRSETNRGILGTGCLRPGGGIYGPEDRMLVSRLVPTFGFNTIQSTLYVDNYSLAHLQYE